MSPRSRFFARLGAFCLAFGLGLLSTAAHATSCEGSTLDPWAGCIGYEACNSLIAVCATCHDTDFECDEEDASGGCVLGSCG